MTKPIKARLDEIEERLRKQAFSSMTDSDYASDFQVNAFQDITLLVGALGVAIQGLVDIANHKQDSIDKIYLILQCEGYQARANQAMADLIRMFEEGK